MSRISFPTTSDRVFLRVIARCDDGQTATDFHTVNISPDLQFRVANAEPEITFEPLETVGIKTFPNPSGEYLHIQVVLSESSEVKISLIDLMGRNAGTIYQANWTREPTTYMKKRQSIKKGFVL